MCEPIASPNSTQMSMLVKAMRMNRIGSADSNHITTDDRTLLGGLVGSNDGLTNPTECCKLAVGDHWTTNIPHGSLVPSADPWLKLDTLPLKVVLTNNKVAAAVVSIAFRITDFQHFIERDWRLMRWLHLL